MTKTGVLFCVMVGLSILCCGDSEPQTGSNTSWFIACDGSQRCKSDLSCVCGLCTAECESDADCEQGVCGLAFDLAASCGDESARRACVPETTASCSEPIEEQFNLGGAGATDCAPGALLCESFDEALSASHRVIEDDQSPLHSQQCFSALGAGSLTRAGTPVNFAHVTMSLSEPVSSGSLYARFYLFLPSSTTFPKTAQLLRIHEGPEPEEDHVITLRVHDERQLSLNFVVDGDGVESSTGVAQLDKWQCIELAIDVADEGAASVLVDGEQVIEASGVDTLDITKPYDSVRALGATANDGAFFDVAFDELIVATEPIGCD